MPEEPEVGKHEIELGGRLVTCSIASPLEYPPTGDRQYWAVAIEDHRARRTDVLFEDGQPWEKARDEIVAWYERRGGKDLLAGDSFGLEEHPYTEYSSEQSEEG